MNTNVKKFRVWTDHDNRMTYPDWIKFNKDGSIETAESLGGNVMQWIGENDNKGVAVYEGDIIHADDREIGGAEIVGEVFYDTDATLEGPRYYLWVMVTLSEIGEGQSGTGVYPGFPINYEIIGNIYEGVQDDE